MYTNSNVALLLNRDQYDIKRNSLEIIAIVNKKLSRLNSGINRFCFNYFVVKQI